MSPSQRKRPTVGSGKGTGKGPTPREAARRQGLFIFGAVFVVLFLVLAISEGLGDPDIPSGDVILVEEVPGDGGKVSEAEFDHALELAAKGNGEDKPPKPDSPKYEEVKEAAVTGLLEGAWIEGEGAEMGITVSDQEIAKELKKVKDESFKNEAEFKKFLKESGFNSADVDERVKLQILSTEIQEEVQGDPPTPSEDEVEDYYEAAKTTPGASTFTEPASRDVRLIRNQEKEKAEKAFAALRKDSSAKSWSRVAKEYSEDPATKDKGGLQVGVTEGMQEEPLDAAIFDASEGELAGPLKTAQGFVVYEVVSSKPETVQPLEQVEDQIKSTLSQQLQQESFAAFFANFTEKWRSRTFCASGYAIDRCANFTGDGRPDSAPPACYEADPKGGRPDACPAPVFQAIPALPGTITPLQPQGTPMAQRPQPEGLKPSAEAPATESIPGLPPTTP